MTKLLAIGYEVRRMVLTRKYFYIFLLLGVSSHLSLTRLSMHGALGTPPFSQLSYTSFISSMNPLLLVTLVLLCAAVFSEKEDAVRKIVFSAPITYAGYLIVKGIAIAAAFLLAAALPIVHSFAYLSWHFRFYEFGDYVHPIAVFLLPSAVFVFGLSMAAGRLSVKLVYGLLPIVFLIGVLNLDLPVWVDLCANNFLLEYHMAVFRSLGSLDVVYHVPRDFLLSRCVLVTCGVVLFVFACRKPRA